MSEAAVNPVGFTSQITAAFRAVEMQHTPAPIITDPLATHLAGTAAWQTAFTDWQQLVALQGAGKSLRVPARNRLVDDLLQEAVRVLVEAGVQAVQVVNIGCGMDSKPWRLRLGIPVTWWDVDQPGVMQLKQQLLAAAGAASVQQGHQSSTPPQTAASTDGTPPRQAPLGEAGPAAAAVQFPLLVDCWRPVAADLSQTRLRSCLESSGFDPHVPTVWLAEALLYYLPLDQALQLLSEMGELSAPGSRLVATCINKELYVADHEGMDKGHYFHAMWHFSMDDLLQEEEGGVARLEAAGWALEMQPRTAADLALECCARDTYVATYGGAECIFTARIAV